MRVIQTFGWPASCAGIELAGVLKAMELDKKVRERAVRWVLLKDIGQTIFRDDVPVKDVVGVLQELLA